MRGPRARRLDERGRPCVARQGGRRRGMAGAAGVNSPDTARALARSVSRRMTTPCHRPLTCQPPPGARPASAAPSSAGDGPEPALHRRARRHASRSAPASSSRSSAPPAAARARCSTSPPACSRRAAAAVEVFGEPLAGINRRAGYMFQTESLMPWRTALGNVAAGLEFRGVAEADASAQARRVAEARRPRRLRRPLSAPALGRHAQARRPGADAGARPRHHPDGRAVLRARHPDPPADGKRGARALGREEEGGALHHPRPRRGDRDERPRRLPVRRAGARIRSASSRSTCRGRATSPRCETTPRFVELHQAIWDVLREEVLAGYRQQLAA